MSGSPARQEALAAAAAASCGAAGAAARLRAPGAAAAACASSSVPGPASAAATAAAAGAAVGLAAPPVASTSGRGAVAAATLPVGRPPRRAAARLLCNAAGPGGGSGGGSGARHAGTAVKAPPKKDAAAPKAGAAAAAGADSDGPWLIVGLGNPGPRYERTRHNVGFMVVDALARAEGIDMRKLEKNAAVGRGEVAGRKVLLVKPVTFMNNSGESVAALAKYYKVPLSRCLVISDDLDQPPAAVKLKMRGGHGGHNGLRSIIDRLGGKSDFPRLKIGIGRPTGAMDVASYVLQDFRQSEMAEVDDAVAESLRIINSILTLGLDKALSGQRV